MYQKGHLGVALLVFAPLGFALVRAGYPTVALFTGGFLLWFAMLPDVDHRLPGVTHRGVTHTLLFALAVGAVLGGAGFLVEGQASLGDDVVPVGLAAYGFFLGTLTVLAHLLGDVLTPMGVPFFWPLSSRRYSLSLTPAKSTVANWGLLGVGVAAVSGALYLSVTL